MASQNAGLAERSIDVFGIGKMCEGCVVWIPFGWCGLFGENEDDDEFEHSFGLTS